MSLFCAFVEDKLQNGIVDVVAASAVKSFLACAKQYRDINDCDEMLKLWVAEMMLDDKKRSTIKTYVDKLHNIYNEWSCDRSDDFPVMLHPDTTDGSVARAEAESNFRIACSILKKSSDTSELQAFNIFQYLLYNIDASLADVVRLKFGEIGVLCSQVEDILDSIQCSPRRKYVFSLEQGRRRDPQIIRDVVSVLHLFLRSSGMIFKTGFSRDSITNIWIVAALKCGITLPEIRAMLKSIPVAFAPLGLVTPAEISVERKNKILCMVADYLNDNTARWFVMRLRSGVEPETVYSMLEACMPDEKRKITFYYPTRTIVRRESKRLIKKEIPFLPDILFFKTKIDRVPAMFRCIGSKAWCYRQSSRPNSPYSSISRTEMELFQRSIGRFSDDMDIEFVERDQPFEPGSSVRINGGGVMSGHEGVVSEVETKDGHRIYTLRLSPTAAVRWTVKVQETYLERIS